MRATDGGRAPREHILDATLRWRALSAFALDLQGRLTPDGGEGQLLGLSYF